MAKEITVHLIRVFTTEQPDSGNIAAVVQQNGLLPHEKQKIAKKLGQSETVFIQQEYQSYSLEFYTPNKPIPMCGHATLAAAAYLNHSVQDLNTIEFEIGEKMYPVFYMQNSYWMQQNLPTFGKKIDQNLVADSLQVNPTCILQTQIVSTGLPDLLIQINSVEKLHSIQPDFEKIKYLSKDLDLVGYHLFAIASEPNVTAYCRNFAPLFGIKEESGTGTSSGALACFLFQKNLIRRQDYVFRQGWQRCNPSEIQVQIEFEESISQVLVGGKVHRINF